MSSIANQQRNRTRTALVCNVENEIMALHPKQDARFSCIVRLKFFVVNMSPHAKVETAQTTEADMGLEQLQTKDALTCEVVARFLPPTIC